MRHLTHKLLWMLKDKITSNERIIRSTCIPNVHICCEKAQKCERVILRGGMACTQKDGKKTLSRNDFCDLCYCSLYTEFRAPGLGLAS